MTEVFGAVISAGLPAVALVLGVIGLRYGWVRFRQHEERTKHLLSRLNIERGVDVVRSGYQPSDDKIKQLENEFVANASVDELAKYIDDKGNLNIPPHVLGIKPPQSKPAIVPAPSKPKRKRLTINDVTRAAQEHSLAGDMEKFSEAMQGLGAAIRNSVHKSLRQSIKAGRGSVSIQTTGDLNVVVSNGEPDSVFGHKIQYSDDGVRVDGIKIMHKHLREAGLTVEEFAKVAVYMRQTQSAEDVRRQLKLNAAGERVDS
jgi:citrate lyase gamma subunit